MKETTYNENGIRYVWCDECQNRRHDNCEVKSGAGDKCGCWSCFDDKGNAVKYDEQGNNILPPVLEAK
jgi:hypothetical protein